MKNVECDNSSSLTYGLINQNTDPRDRLNLVQLGNGNNNEDDGMDLVRNEQVNIHFQERIEDDDDDINWIDGDDPRWEEKVLGRPRCEDGDMELEDGHVEREIWGPTYTLGSGEKVDIPIDWFGRIESISLQSIVEDAVLAWDTFYPAFQLICSGEEDPKQAMSVAFDKSYGRA